MKKLHVLLLFILGFIAAGTAQNKQIPLEEIWNGEFRTEGMDVLRSMNSGTEYTVLNSERDSKSSMIDKYAYSTLEKLETIVSSADSKEIPFFTSYEFSQDESKILLATEIEPIFRRSTLGIFYLYDVASKSIIKIADSKIQEPTLSPDGSMVAYVQDNNLFVFNVANNSTIQV
ncbi:MAG: DPP IV N-terminal domain-containing protein, partial [Flavobacteriales bacterium]